MWVGGWVGGGVRDETRKGIMRAKEETFCLEREGNRLHPMRGQRGRLSGGKKRDQLIRERTVEEQRTVKHNDRYVWKRHNKTHPFVSQSKSTEESS